MLNADWKATRPYLFLILAGLAYALYLTHNVSGSTGDAGAHQEFFDITLEGFSTGVLALFAILQYRESRKSNEQQARAFVFVGDLEAELTVYSDGENKAPLMDGKNPDLWVTRFAVSPKWSNSGDTPTRNLRIRVNWGNGNTRTIGTYENIAWRPFFVGPKATANSGFIEMPGLNGIIQNGMPELSPDIPGMFIWGCADYQDVFGKAHFVRWCYWVRPERHKGDRLRSHFIQWDAYNEAGEGPYPGED